jgi:SanA protein
VFKRKFKAVLRMLIYALIIIIAILGIVRVVIILTEKSKIYTIEGVPPARVAIVFGAGLLRNGEPTRVLQHRVDTAVDLYKAGKIEKLLMSGDNRFIDYNEPGAMRTRAVELGVPADDIVMDFAGRSTYDTCYRARAIFGVQEAILVTQEFHLWRALFTCNNIGLPAVGVPSDRTPYQPVPYIFWNMREIPATLKAVIETLITHPEPILGQPEPIFPGE